MPELPEVESFRKFVEDTSLKQRIASVQLSTRNMLLNTSDKELKDTLEGNSFTGTFRHGKFLFIRLKSKDHLMLHFGMTGDLAYNEEPQKPKSFAIIFNFSNKHQLIFSDPRRLGKIALVKDVEAFIEKRGYGKDALQITRKEFVNRLQNKRTPIKVSLMDQKTIAGVGNEFSDEILFQSQIHPSSSTAALSEKQLALVYVKMKKILTESVKQNADRSKLKKYFFLGSRRARMVCPSCSGETEMQTIGGRSSYFCPSCQKVYC